MAYNEMLFSCSSFVSSHGKYFVPLPLLQIFRSDFVYNNIFHAMPFFEFDWYLNYKAISKK